MASTKRGALVFALALCAISCRPKKPPIATRMWLGPNGGCVTTPVHETSGDFACWGLNQAGQLGDGTTTARPFATKMHFDLGVPRELALGERHSCGVFGNRAYCWGDGDKEQLGRVIAGGSLVPMLVSNPDEESPSIAVGVGVEHTCIASGDRLRCFGSNAERQLDDFDSRRTKVVSFALGEAHTCAAYEGPRSVVCRGRVTAAPREPILENVPVKELAAGGSHTCALLADTTVRCWGRNAAGQLGDGTTQDSLKPVLVPGLGGVIQVAAGTRHTCVLFAVGTIACWGANDRHQLANGTTESSATPHTVVGLVGGKEIAAAGDGTCAKLEGGYVRCWGRNDANQLGSGSQVEHSVPVQIQFR